MIRRRANRMYVRRHCCCYEVLGMGRRFAEAEAWVAEDDAPWKGRNAVTLVPRSRAHKAASTHHIPPTQQQRQQVSTYGVLIGRHARQENKKYRCV